MRLGGRHSLRQQGGQLLQLGPPAEVHVCHVVVIVQQALQLLFAQAQGFSHPGKLARPWLSPALLPPIWVGRPDMALSPTPSSVKCLQPDLQFSALQGPQQGMQTRQGVSQQGSHLLYLAHAPHELVHDTLDGAHSLQVGFVHLHAHTARAQACCCPVGCWRACTTCCPTTQILAAGLKTDIATRDPGLLAEQGHRAQTRHILAPSCKCPH